MIDCKKIEALMWTLNDLPAPDRSFVEAHLKECVACRGALETIRLIGRSAALNEQAASSIDPAAFDNAVMARIRSLQRPARMEAPVSRQYILRTAFSFALAAGIVLFLVRSISDLSVPLPEYKDMAQKGDSLAGRFTILNLHLAEPEQPAERKAKNEPADKRLALQPPPASAEAPSAGAPEVEKKSEADNTILSAPVAAPSPESVNIEAVYLADAANMPLAQQQSRAASLSDVYVDTGAIQSLAPPSSVLVNMDRMPRSIQMVIPEYPVWARKQGMSATVWVRARIDESGRVSEARIISCTTPGEGFEEVTLQAAQKSKYQPAVSNGVNIPVWVAYPVKFVFQETRK